MLYEQIKYKPFDEPIFHEYTEQESKNLNRHGMKIEKLLGIKPNNCKKADTELWGEIKAKNLNSYSQLTLLHLDQLEDRKLILLENGWQHKTKLDSLSFRCSVKNKPNGRGYYTRISGNNLYVFNKDKKAIATWDKSKIEERVCDKLRVVKIVTCKSDKKHLQLCGVSGTSFSVMTFSFVFRN